MPSSLDDVEFLARSPNRIAVLEALATTAQTHRQLQEETGASRVTVQRVLGDLADRAWVRARGDVYELTVLGELVVESFSALQRTLATVAELDDVVRWLPADVGLDVRLLAGASVATPTTSDPFALLRTAEEHLSAATDVRLLTNGTAPETLELMRRRTERGEQRLQFVTDAATLDATLADDEMRADLRTILDTGNALLFRHDAPIPFVLSILDDGVDLGLTDDDGIQRVLVHSDDEAVMEWAEKTFREYRGAATQVDPERIAADE